MRSLVMVAVVVACGDNVAGPLPQPDAAPPSLRVYLSFDGVTLVPPVSGSAPSSRSNTTSVVTMPTTVPAYLSGVAGRDGTIAMIVRETTARMAPLDVEVVTVRPLGDYFEIVYTGAPSVVGLASGTSSVAYFGCTATPPDLAPHHDGVALMFQSDATGDAYLPVFRGNLAVAVLGLENNIPPTSEATDCMCFASNQCNALAQACTIGGPGTIVDVANACPGAPATVDELSLFVAEFGAHP